MQRGKKWRGKKEQQQEQGSEGNKTHRDRKRTESLRGGPVFRKAELLETEKLKPAKVAGAFGGKRKKKKDLHRAPWRTEQPHSLMGKDVGWRREKL